jgi:hypothetical protein
MDEKLAEAMGLLTKAAQSIGVEAVRLWPQMVGITFVRSVFTAALLVAVLIWGVVLLRKYLAYIGPVLAGKTELFDLEPFTVIIGGSFVASLILLPLLLMPDALAGVFYPEAKTVLDLVTKR